MLTVCASYFILFVFGLRSFQANRPYFRGAPAKGLAKTRCRMCEFQMRGSVRHCRKRTIGAQYAWSRMISARQARQLGDGRHHNEALTGEVEREVSNVCRLLEMHTRCTKW